MSHAERLSINMRFKIETAPTNNNYVLVDPETKEIVSKEFFSFTDVLNEQRLMQEEI